jgi:hypothetical protein
MAFEGTFQRQFSKSVSIALSTGVRGAFVEGCTYGIASALIYLAEALLFYVGAVLISKGTYSYLQMVEVLNLIIFSVTIGSQLMVFSTSLSTISIPVLVLTQCLRYSGKDRQSRTGHSRLTSASEVIYEY